MEDLLQRVANVSNPLDICLLAKSLDLQKSLVKAHKLFITNIKNPITVLDVIFSESFTLKHTTTQFILIGYCVDAALFYNCSLCNHIDNIKSLISSLLIMTKTAVPIRHINPLKLFIQEYFTAEYYSTSIFKVAQVSFLRSPEASIQVVNQITSNLDYDMSNILSNQFCGILLPQFPSKNVKIRDDAFNLFDTLISKSSQNLETVTESLLKALNQNSPLPEHRLVYFRLLKGISCQKSSQLISDKLSSIIQKENSDAVLPIALSCFFKHLSTSSADRFLDFVLKGLNHEKSLYRRCILSEINHLFDRNLEVPFEDNITTEIYQVLVSVQKLGIAVLDPKKEGRSIYEGYYAAKIIISCSRYSSPAKFVQDCSFLFQEQFYQKLNTTEEKVLMAHIIGQVFKSDALLFALVPHSIYSDPYFVNFAQAIVWTLTVHHEPRKVLCRYMNYAIIKSLEAWNLAAKLVSFGIGGFLRDTEKSVSLSELFWKSKVARSSNEPAEKALNALYSILPHKSITCSLEGRIMALKSILVISCHPIMSNCHGKDLFIRLCYYGDVSPEFIQEETSLIKGWLTHAESFSLGSVMLDPSDSFRDATLNSLSLSVQTAPNLVIPLSLDWASNVFKDTEYINLTVRDVCIWKTPVGELYDNPLEKSKSVISSRPKNDDEKWEEEIKMKLSKGKKVEMNSKEKAIFNECLKDESIIREKVQKLFHRLLSAIHVIEAIISGIENPFKIGFDLFLDMSYPILNSLLTIIERECVTTKAVLLGNRLCGTLHKVAAKMSMPDFEYSDFIFVLLRAIGCSESWIPEKYLNQNLEDCLIAQCHSLIEFMNDRQLSASTFALILPLLSASILKTGRVKLIKEKSHTDILLKSSDVLMTHSSLSGVGSLSIPHSFVLSLLLFLLDTCPRLTLAAHASVLKLSEMLSDPSKIAGFNCKIMMQKQAEDSVNQLIAGLFSENAAVRLACLEALELFSDIGSNSDFQVNVWVCKSDIDEKVQNQANLVWEIMVDSEFISIELLPKIVSLVTCSKKSIRQSASQSLKSALSFYPEKIDYVISRLHEDFQELAAEPVPQFDDYGMVRPESLQVPDKWENRTGIASALTHVAPYISSKKQVMANFDFMIAKEALGDKSQAVRQLLLEAGLSCIASHGEEFIKELIDMFDAYLEKPPQSNEKHDLIRQAVVILLGNLAQKLVESDRRIPLVIKSLMDTLSTPSEVVQIAVSECLGPLIEVNKSKVHEYLKILSLQLFEGPKYGLRRGAAYGIAGLVKGSGIGVLNNLGVLADLQQALSDKKNLIRREGGLLAVETLSLTLGRIFEPFIIQLLPLLLACFSDGNSQIRQATEDACKAIMSKISAYGLKLVLPTLMDALRDRQWRTKIGSIEVMASMSALAPKQLGQSLPMIVPEVCEALADTHQKVQGAAKQALSSFGKVIKNPEIHGLVPILIEALVDPNSRTSTALDSLLDTTFVHYIDAPSLALLIPIIRRGMTERQGGTKIKATQIVGNMARLTEESDLKPYLSKILPYLKEILIDPVPQTRATAAKSFGSLVAKLGEKSFPGLLDELMAALSADKSMVDRSGAAQGISEILAGIGVKRLEAILEETLEKAKSKVTCVRQGYTVLLVYLPMAFKETFVPFIKVVVPTILTGLADDDDEVREAALQAGQIIVRNYARNAIELLLPQLEVGLFNQSWRIRQNSVRLMGDLLFQISGIKSKSQDNNENDEGVGNSNARMVLKEVLGEDQFHRVLSRIYIIWSDSAAVVRNLAISVWKAIISNTPKTLKEILKLLMSDILLLLASENEEKQDLAAKTLGDLVRKLGERILNDVIPILEDGLNSTDVNTRKGVCVAISEIVHSIQEVEENDFILRCVPLIYKGIVDSEETVRKSAASSFDALHQKTGARAIDAIIPDLLVGLKTDKSGNALDGLTMIMAVRSNIVFPVIIPTLLTSPITPFNARALGSLISVAGVSLNRRISAIFPALLEGLKYDETGDIEAAINALFESVEGEDGIHQMMIVFNDDIVNPSAERRLRCLKHIGTFFSSTSEDIEDYIPSWISTIISFFNERQGHDMMMAARTALESLVKLLDKESLEKYVSSVARGVEEASFLLEEGEEIAAFNAPKGLTPILPILVSGLMNGNGREDSARLLGHVVKRTSQDALKAYVTQITGPLIRVVGDRLPANVKIAILETLELLLVKIPLTLKPFLPQLQRTFSKSLSDTTSYKLRDQAVICLGLLIPLQSRLDPLALELIQGVKGGEEETKSSFWEALYMLLLNLDSNRRVNEASIDMIKSIILKNLLESNENDVKLRVACAKCLGALCRYVEPTVSAGLIRNVVTPLNHNGWITTHGQLLAFAQCSIDNASDLETSIKIGLEGLRMAKTCVLDAAIEFAKCSGKPKEFVAGLAKAVKDGGNSPESRCKAIHALEQISKSENVLAVVIPVLMVTVRDRNVPVKTESEKCLFEILQLGTTDRIWKHYKKTLDASEASKMDEYLQKVLIPKNQ